MHFWMHHGITQDSSRVTMISRTPVSIATIVFVIIWTGLLILSGESVSIQWFKLYPTLSGISFILICIFNKWIWKLPRLYPHIISTPNLQGTWKGYIKSSWLNPDTDETIPPIEAYLAITQTFFSIQVRLMTTESNSDLITGKLYRNTQDISIISIAGIYRNTPKALRREINPIHHGGIIIQVQGNSDFTLEGEY